MRGARRKFWGALQSAVNFLVRAVATLCRLGYKKCNLKSQHDILLEIYMLYFGMGLLKGITLSFILHSFYSDILSIC